MNDEPKRSWFDGTINLPTILSTLVMAVGACGFCINLYNGIEHRVTVLEQHDLAAADNRTEVKDSLKAINDKLDKLNDRLIANSAGQRPDIQRWAK
ncbi:MAG: hypothetical protein PW735_01675 [Acidobacteriaceae bacterium]|nr:hypothetical protein [Acidobacteriaceae bacterium]